MSRKSKNSYPIANQSESVLARSGKSTHSSGTTDDERYPGSFFRRPGVPVPVKTVWSLAK